MSLLKQGIARNPALPVGRYILYAIGEIALVVIGILIALQINNWNEWRKERILEKEILTDLGENLERNIAVLEDRIADLTRQNHSVDIVLNSIDKNLFYHDSLNLHFHLSRFGFGRAASLLSHTGYDALQNQGINIILNKTLREEIVELFEMIYSELEFLDSGFAKRNVYNFETINHLFYQEQSALIPFSYGKVLVDHQYYALLKAIRHDRKNISYLSERCVRESRNVLELIEKELEG